MEVVWQTPPTGPEVQVFCGLTGTQVADGLLNSHTHTYTQHTCTHTYCVRNGTALDDYRSMLFHAQFPTINIA